MTVHVIYGSDSGRTKAAAAKIAARLNGKAINISDASVADFEDCELLVLGSPTYGGGDLQMDWETGIDMLAEAHLAGKKVALFGLGDQSNYPESFADAVGMLFDSVVKTGAEVVGFTDTNGYEFEGSMAVRGGQFVGLILDQDNQAGKSDKRIEAWTGQLL